MLGKKIPESVIEFVVQSLKDYAWEVCEEELCEEMDVDEVPERLVEKCVRLAFKRLNG